MTRSRNRRSGNQNVPPEDDNNDEGGPEQTDSPEPQSRGCGHRNYTPPRRPFRFQSFKTKGSVETWKDYKRRLGQALSHQGYESSADRKQALLTCADPELYRLMVALCFPQVLESEGVTYEHIIGLLDDQFEEDVSEAMAEYEFEARKQKPDESVAEWLADLRQLAIPCKFLEADLSRRLRGQLVRGVADKECQAKLLEASDLDLKKAITIIKTHMRAKAEGEALNKRQPEAESSSSRDNVMFVRRPDCWRCGAGHAPDTCWAKDKDCRARGKKGHIAKKCPGGGQGESNNTSTNNNNSNRNKKRRERRRNVNLVRAVEHAASQPNPAKVGNQGGAAASTAAQPREQNRQPTRGQAPAQTQRTNHVAAWEDWGYRINQVNDSTVKGYYPGPDRVRVTVDGVDFRVELDNGAPTGLMSEREFKRHWPEERLTADRDRMHTWSGEAIQGIKSCEVTVRVGEQEARLPLFVAQGDGPFIMGRLWMDTFGFKVTGPVDISRPVYKMSYPFRRASPKPCPG